MKRAPLADLWTLWQHAWQGYNQRFRLVVGLSLFANTGLLVLSVLPNSVTNTWIVVDHAKVANLTTTGWQWLGLIGGVGFIFGVWGTMASFRAVTSNSLLTFRQALKLERVQFWSSIATSAMYAVIVIGGTLLFIAPGIYLAQLLGFAPLLVFTEGLRPRAALRRSATLIRGYWWATFWRQVATLMAVLVILSIGASSFSSLAGHFGATAGPLIYSLLYLGLLVVVYPLQLFFLVVLYRHVADRQVSTTTVVA